MPTRLSSEPGLVFLALAFLLLQTPSKVEAAQAEYTNLGDNDCQNQAGDPLSEKDGTNMCEDDNAGLQALTANDWQCKHIFAFDAEKIPDTIKEADNITVLKNIFTVNPGVKGQTDRDPADATKKKRSYNCDAKFTATTPVTPGTTEKWKSEQKGVSETYTQATLVYYRRRFQKLNRQVSVHMRAMLQRVRLQLQK